MNAAISLKNCASRALRSLTRLRQAMGGGKTHNLIALGLLAKYPALRQKVISDFYDPDPRLGEVKVIAFSGRETDTPLG